MKKHIICGALLAFASTLFLSNVPAYNNVQVKTDSISTSHSLNKAYENVSLASSGDSFKLLDKSYAANESFVYTADLYFRNGQAGGLIIGGQENDHYYVFNMDRFENHVKLIYFSSNGNGGFDAHELKSDYFIGNDKITESELSVVRPQVRDIENVNLKVVLTSENDHAYVEFFVEGIKRFGIESVIDLNDMGTSFRYQGGALGLNCFNGDVYLENVEIGKSDYSYYSEPYRNQFHFQPFAKWSNDPNALVYYKGYYHVFYQTNPFGNLWGSMYWGHARSKDLIHFEYLPICLFPDTEEMGFGPGVGYMWSGCAIEYKQGMSFDIDTQQWFKNSGGNGLLGIFTRDGGLQDQVVISSDDGGLTWTKRHRIPQTLISQDKVGFRDPKLFPLVKTPEGQVSIWGMTLSSYEWNKGWFLQSDNLLDWSIAGEFPLPTPECIGVGTLKDKDGVEHSYLTNKSRSYILGTMSYDYASRKVKFIDEKGIDISTYNVDNIPLKPLDFGPDSYASQSFYISDPESKYFGKDLVLNWFSGDLNASFCTGPGEYAGLRGRWNGGFTTPVEYGIEKVEGEYLLSQTPITLNNEDLEKTEIVSVKDQALTDNTNLLADVHTHIFELQASIETDNKPITFKVDVGDNEYMQLGWNETDGYYVDRTYLDDKGINTNIDWHKKYASGIKGNSNTKTFYVLSDNNGLEVFCENFALSFYFVTTASVFSTGASLEAPDCYVNYLELNEIKSAYQKEVAEGEGILYVSNMSVDLNTKFVDSKFITAYFTGDEELSWEILDNEENIIEYETSNKGISVKGLKEGRVEIKVSAGQQTHTIIVNVYDEAFVSDLTFTKDRIISGQWTMKNSGIRGEKISGNAFILASEKGDDFTYTGKFDIINGVAGALVFRAERDMSRYLVANYDANEGIVKLWSNNGELARSERLDLSLRDITIAVKASGANIQIIASGRKVIDYNLKANEPLEGHFGLNVYSGEVEFKELSIAKEINDYEYYQGDFALELDMNQHISEIYNITNGNTKIDSSYYYQLNDTLVIKASYFSLLDHAGKYEFKIVGSAYIFNIVIDVKDITRYEIPDIVVEQGTSINVFIGNNVITTLKVNDVVVEESDYKVKDYVLTIDQKYFTEGDNVVSLNDDVSFSVTIVAVKDVITNKYTITDYTPLIVSLSVGVPLILAGATVAVILIIKRKKK